jgi:hypothetical protein
MLTHAVAALMAGPVLAVSLASTGPAAVTAPAAPPPASCGPAGYPAGYGIWCPGRLHRAVPGDSLRALARKYLCSSDRWPGPPRPAAVRPL